MSLDAKKILAEKIIQNQRRVWEWSASHASKNPPPFYSSIDLRDARYKITPVDSNLYPAGFNNICPEDIRAASPVLKNHIATIATQMKRTPPKNVLILPESHTHNSYYIENLYYLREIIQNAGYQTQIGWFGPLPALPEGAPNGVVELKSQTEKILHAREIRIEGGVLSAGDFVPDLILLNNDFSGGYPEILDRVAQPIAPSHTLGWHSRKKSEHFRHYNKLAREFAEILGVDPWLVTIDTEEVTPVNFNEDEGLDEAADRVEQILARMQEAFTRHGVKRKPFAFVKNNSGTYGMGIMVVHSADEIRSMNRRTKNKMSVGKNRQHIGSVVVQEGIPTATLVDRLAAEPVIYLFGNELIGGFLRTNTEKSDEDNLNSQGMVFRKLCMSDLRKPTDEPEETEKREEPLFELVYGAIAQISALATGIELAEHAKTKLQMQSQQSAELLP